MADICLFWVPWRGGEKASVKTLLKQMEEAMEVNAEAEVSSPSSPCPLAYFPGLCQTADGQKTHVI